jgi:AraC-like DNA-binding protein
MGLVSKTARDFGPLACDIIELGPVSVRRWRGALPAPLGGRVAAHRGLELSWYEAGTGEYTFEGERFSGAEGNIVVVRPEVEHLTTFESTGPFRACALEIDPVWAEEAAEACGRSSALPALVDLAAPGGQTLRYLSRAIEAEADSVAGASDAIDATALEGILDPFLASLMMRFAPVADPRPRSRPVRIAVEFMRANLAETIDVDALAASANMGRFQFTRRFKEEVGHAPYEYLTLLRVRHAATLLERRGVTVTQAAFESGFRDLGRFARAFRRELGVLPSAYRAAKRR